PLSSFPSFSFALLCMVLSAFVFMYTPFSQIEDPQWRTAPRTFLDLPPCSSLAMCSLNGGNKEQRHQFLDETEQLNIFRIFYCARNPSSGSCHLGLPRPPHYSQRNYVL
ncbi:unnamed protein product, partial [Ectocarpus sp. 4 AP-2014]